MRIISGKYRGKKILSPKDSATRPLKDLAKESIFNIIIHSNKFNVLLKNSNILDLFSGVGSFGLECLSRGSKKSTFVENYKEALTVLKKNITSLNYEKESFILEKDIIKNLNFKDFKEKFNIIFADPPYKEKNLNLILLKILNSEILDDQGIMIIHRQKNDIDNFPKEFKIIEEKIYGISRVIFGNFN
jgi:16S rRNA (guanine966-N2)-methyltransferase